MKKLIEKPTLSNSEEKEDNQIIKEHENWFEWIVNLPKIVTIIAAIIFFLVGFGNCVDGNPGGIAMLLVGALFCLLLYALMKIAVSYQVLHIYYLKKLQKQDKEKNEKN